MIGKSNTTKKIVTSAMVSVIMEEGGCVRFYRKTLTFLI